MMPADAVQSVAGALAAKHVLREIVRTSVKTPSDEHYFAVMMHKGVSSSLHHLSFLDLAKLLSRPTTEIHRMITEHMLRGSARGGCRICNRASRALKEMIVEEKDKDHGSEDPFSLFIMLSSASSRGAVGR